MFEQLSIPLACTDPTIPDSKKPFECKNLESTDPTDVVNKVTLRVNSNYSAYAMCNIGNDEGKDPLGRPCPIGGYCCYCSAPSHSYPPKDAPCNSTIGLEVIKDHFGYSSHCSKDYDCWTAHTVAKLTDEYPGLWYSPLDIGDCSLHATPEENCTWAVQSIDKIVNATCHTQSFFSAVQKASPTSFAQCTNGTSVAAPNATDPCWVRGFYEAVLGPKASRSILWKVEGLPLEDLIGYWSAPFQSEDPALGGCPGLPIPTIEEAVQLSLQKPKLTHNPQRRGQSFMRKFFGADDEVLA
uniref:Uncharacterized protein n=1 Tax=Coccolithus braarudii TaxID=221442 RepID=A0A7S0LIH3_9EUKA